MSVNILARIPQDSGKVIRCGHDVTMTVGEEACASCDKPAAVVIQGETDSFGFEPVALCGDCSLRAHQSSESWFSAEDVKDRAPRSGHLFFISECTNHDGYGDWCQSFDSYREAVAYHRQIAEKAAPYCGLYPDNGVRELPADEVRERLHRFNQRLREEMEWLDEMEELDRQEPLHDVDDDFWGDQDDWDEDDYQYDEED